MKTKILILFSVYLLSCKNDSQKNIQNKSNSYSELFTIEGCRKKVETNKKKYKQISKYKNQIILKFDLYSEYDLSNTFLVEQVKIGNCIGDIVYHFSADLEFVLLIYNKRIVHICGRGVCGGPSEEDIGIIWCPERLCKLTFNEINIMQVNSMSDISEGHIKIDSIQIKYNIFQNKIIRLDSTLKATKKYLCNKYGDPIYPLKEW